MSASSSRRCLHNYVPAMYEPVIKTCYVYVGDIIFSDPFCLMVSKGLLIYEISRLMPCKHVATERYMHNLRYFSKGVLKTWLCSIQPWSWLQLWSNLACHFHALLLLQNVSWQIVYMLFNLAEVAIVDPCMLWTCSSLG